MAYEFKVYIECEECNFTRGPDNGVMIDQMANEHEEKTGHSDFTVSKERNSKE